MVKEEEAKVESNRWITQRHANNLITLSRRTEKNSSMIQNKLNPSILKISSPSPSNLTHHSWLAEIDSLQRQEIKSHRLQVMVLQSYSFLKATNHLWFFSASFAKSGYQVFEVISSWAECTNSTETQFTQRKNPRLQAMTFPPYPFVQFTLS